jgi:8-oxo-dGTP diphosphatase
MSDSRTRVRDLLRAIVPCDDEEARHRDDAVAWVDSGAGLWRIAKPDVPPRHLVAYFVLVDCAEHAVLLVEHRNAGLWLPTGGHVELDEDPEEAVRRELHEELGISATQISHLSSNPLFVTQTTTVGVGAGHTDVSLWYVLDVSLSTRLTPDEQEFADIRWWTYDEIDTTNRSTFDPHLHRFVRKLAAELSS